jgi:hypothetical protein
MKKRTAYKPRPAGISTRAAGSLPWSYFVVIAICGCIIAAGFLLAARQHFVSMDLGMKNSTLRKQLEELESENRRLTLAREVALAPAEITKTAKGLGFVETTIDPAAPIQVSAATNSPASGVRLASSNAADRTVSPNSIVKTAYQRSSQTAAPKAVVAATTAKRTENVKQSPRPDPNVVARLR